MAGVKFLRQKTKTANPVSSYLQDVFLNKKLNSWLGFLLIAGIAALFGYIMTKGVVLGVGVIGFIVGLSVILICFLNSEAGVYINMVYAFFSSHFSRFLFNDEFPVGIPTSVLVIVTFLGLFVNNVNLKENTSRFFKRRPIVFLFIIFIYLCVQLFNPIPHSFEGWFQVIRKVFEPMLMLFIVYNVFTDYRKIARFFKALFICVFIVGLYGCLQQWHGLFSFEEAWARSDDERFGLIFINGNFRKFSTMSDPTAFGITMAACVLLFMVIGINEKKISRKLILFAGSFVMLLGMVYSGTRTANAMVVGGASLFSLLTIHKTASKVFTLFGVFAFLFLIYVPIYDNPTLIRFRTSFKGNKDESYRVREENRASIRPYIYSHPFGGGLSSTGGNGEKYNPHHELAGFPPDSGYLNKALETGWVGLAMSCILYFVTLQYAIQGYFRVKSDKIKTLFAASAALLFSFYLGELVQEAVGQFANMVVYYPIVAIIIKLRELNKPPVSRDI